MVHIVRTMLVLLSFSTSAFAAGTYTGTVRTVATFNPALLQTPEYVAVRHDGTLMVSLALTGEVWTISPGGDAEYLATLDLGAPPLTPCFGYLPIMGAMSLDILGNAYVSVSSCNPAKRGIWRVQPNGSTQLVASLPPEALPNGVEVHLGRVYVADSSSGKIWTTSIFGTGQPATVWTNEPLLEPVPNTLGAPGANGIQFYKGEMLVVNSSAFSIVAVPFHFGQAGQAYVKHQLNVGCDDFAVDKIGRIYCTTDPFQTVHRINPDGTSEIFLDAENGLDGPTSATFGRGFHGKKTLYISNASFPFFPSTGNGPSILAVDTDVAGYFFD